MTQLNVNGNVGQAIPLYQKGFNWIKYWLGFLFGCCLCLILAAAITFITLYILAQTGVIKSTRPSGRMMPAVFSITSKKPSGRMKSVNELIMSKEKISDKKSLPNLVSFDENSIKKEITERKYLSKIMLREKLLKDMALKEKNFKYSAA